MSDKKLYFEVASNGDFSVTVQNLDQAKEAIEGDLAEIDDSEKEDMQYTIDPVFLTDAEYEYLPEQ